MLEDPLQRLEPVSANQATHSDGPLDVLERVVKECRRDRDFVVYLDRSGTVALEAAYLADGLTGGAHQSTRQSEGHWVSVVFDSFRCTAKSESPTCLPTMSARKSTTTPAIVASRMPRAAPPRTR